MENTVNALSLQNDASIVYEYHHHEDGEGNLYPDDSKVLYTTISPGGCFTVGSHAHDKTSTCSYRMEETVTGCSGTLTYGGVVSHSGEDKYSCNTCGSEYIGNYQNVVGRGGYNGTSCWNTRRTSQKVFTCGNQPVNTYRLGCHRRENEIESATVVFNPSGT